MTITLKINYILFSIITIALTTVNRFYVNTGLKWYYTLTLPSYTPPSWFIVSMWTTIYVLTTVTIIIVWNSFERNKVFYVIIGLFIFNACLNVLWSYLFFYHQTIGFALIDAFALVTSLLTLVVTIGQRSLLTAALLIPYLGWTFFATWLNLIIFFIN